MKSSRVISHAQENEGDDLVRWRHQVLSRILCLVFLLGAVIAVPSIAFAISQGIHSIVIVDTVAVLWVGLAALRPTLPYAFRAWSLVGLCHLLGVVFLLRVGAASQIYLLAVPVLAALFLGARAGFATLASTTLALFAIGLGTDADLPLIGLDHVPVIKWGLIAANFAFIGGILTAATVILLGRLERSVLHQQAISSSLEENAARLATANTELQNEIANRRLAQEQSARLTRAIEQAGDGIMIADNNGRVVYANTACGRFCTVAASQMVGSNVDSLWPIGDPLVQVNEVLAAHGSLATTISRNDSRNRSQAVDVTVAPLREEAGHSRYHIVVLRDVTHERHLEARLRQSEKLEAVGTLAGGIAHDFNNLIGAILAVGESIRDGGSEATPDAVEPIIRACHRARDIVRQMMMFGGQTVRERHPIAVAGIVHETLPLLRAALPATIRIHCEAETRASVVAEPAEVQQILMNLATNAAHAMQSKGGGKLYLSVADFIPDRAYVASHPGIESGTSYVRLVVRDTGEGIDNEHLPRIFEPFFTTKAQGRGTGLGLASVHGIVTALGGTIDVYTEIGLGTAFHIYLPSADPKAVDEDGTSDLAEGAQPVISGGRILLVDDEDSILRIGRIFLTNAGYEVNVASDGEEARRLLEAAPDDYDLLVTDLTMPGLSGADLIRAAHQLRPALPAILTSGFGYTMTPDEQAELAPFTFLQKPYSQVHLSAAVRDMLSSRG